jgi:hypothetical protein
VVEPLPDALVSVELEPVAPVEPVELLLGLEDEPEVLARPPEVEDGDELVEAVSVLDEPAPVVELLLGEVELFDWSPLTELLELGELVLLRLPEAEPEPAADWVSLLAVVFEPDDEGEELLLPLPAFALAVSVDELLELGEVLAVLELPLLELLPVLLRPEPLLLAPWLETLRRLSTVQPLAAERAFCSTRSLMS